MKCERCGNTSFDKNGDCKYCIWKGTIGHGDTLKKMVKEINKRTDKNRPRGTK